MLTGKLTGMGRQEAIRRLEALGAEVKDSITAAVTTVVAGEGAGSKLEKARSRGLQIMDKQALAKLLEEAE